MEYHPFVIYRRIPFALQTVTGPVISYISIICNVIICVCLNRKSIRSPATVLMQGLAVADILTALCMYGFEPLFYVLYETIESEKNSDKRMFRRLFSDEVWRLITLRYPYCLFYYLLGQFSEWFHLTSMLFTSSLGMQKLFAISFPIWTRTNNTLKASYIICTSLVTIVTIVYIPRLFVVFFDAGTNGTCTTSSPNHYIEAYVLSFHPILIMILSGVGLLCMICSTIIIVVSLRKRKLLLKQDSISSRDRKACKIVICVMIVFLITESPRIYINTKLFTTFSSDIGKHDIIWKRINSNVEKQLNTFECIHNTLLAWTWWYHHDNKTDTNLYFTFDPCDVQDEWFHDDWKTDVRRDAFYVNTWGIDKAKEVVDELYVRHILNRYSMAVDNFIDNSLEYVINVTYCSYQMYHNYTRNLYVDQLGIVSSCIRAQEPTHICAGINSVKHCTYQVFHVVLTKLEYFVLGSASYCEFMNFALNVFSDQNDVSLEEIKLYIEILKLCTVLGCASNFVIYVSMSELFRQAIWKCK